MKKSIVFLFVSPLIAILLSAVYGYSLYSYPYQGEDVTFVIKAGDRFGPINYRLKEKGLINSTRVFHYTAKWRDLMTKFRPGSYVIKKGMTTSDILDAFVKGPQDLVNITIPEGKNMFEVAKLVESNEICSYEEFINDVRDQEFLKNLAIEGPSAEGYLYPETYRFSKGLPCKNVIRTMVKVFKTKTANLDFSKTTLSPHQAIILASVVEKETGVGHERPMIAGVFFNRLKKRMRLQSDPTTIYGIYENFDGNLRKKHLRQKTPYNTYKIPALPLGPIANPGLAAIKAVLEPAAHKYLYFVSQNDGTHVFTETYKKHLQAVNKWQKTRANRVGKSWRDRNKKD